VPPTGTPSILEFLGLAAAQFLDKPRFEPASFILTAQ